MATVVNTNAPQCYVIHKLPVWLHLFQLEVQEKNLQLEHSQQLLSMQQHELESEAILVRTLSSTLKKYCYLLEGHNLITETMGSEYDVSSFEMSCSPVNCEVLMSVLMKFQVLLYVMPLQWRTQELCSGGGFNKFS
jgi:hypothetical protein